MPHFAPISNTTSTFISSQFPEFIRDNYPAFISFVQNYYQWAEQASANGFVYQSKQLLAYNDVDSTTTDFLQYFVNDFLPYFPQNTALDQRKLIKVARQFYQTKGSLQSFQFLFEVIYGLYADIYYPKNQVLRCSAGTWEQPQALQIVVNNADENFDFQLLVGRQGLGSISNVACVIESATAVVDPSLGFEILELFVSNVSGEFDDLESLNVIYGFDEFNNPLIFSEKIIAALSGINIVQGYQGLRYQTGDPVVIIGGLEPSDPNAQKAIAEVGNVTSGSLSSVQVGFGGYDYRVSPNDVINVINGVGDNTGTGAVVTITAIDTGNLTFVLVNTDSIEFKANVAVNSANFGFTNTALANANTPLGTAFAFANIEFGPIIQMNVTSGGGNYTQVPTINIQTTYYSDYTNDFALIDDEPDVLATQQYIDDIGYIAAVQVLNGGSGYSNTTDEIVCIGVNGYGATFNFITVGGAISNVIVTSPGAGYFVMPTLAVVNTANIANASAGVGASLLAFGYGQGAVLNVAVNQVGVIEDIVLISRGFDYISTPNVSLRIWDVPIIPLSNTQFFQSDSFIYQGANASVAYFSAFVDSYNVATSILRLYNYQGTINANANLVSTTVNAQFNLANTGGLLPNPYGNGLAKAYAIFQNGLINFPGFYSSTAGFLSSDQYLQDAVTYHNYSYKIVTAAGLNTYKQTLTDIAHPAGMSMLGTYAIESDSQEGMQAYANINIIPASIGGSVNTNAFITPAIINGTNTYFVGNVSVGDMIYYNFNDDTRPSFVKLITVVNNANTVTVESNSRFFFDTLVSISNGSNIITSSNFTGNVDVNDILYMNANGNIIYSIVQVPASNTLQVNTVFDANVSNIIMMVFPSINNASYSIIKAAI
jgi:hypothetical protein